MSRVGCAQTTVQIRKEVRTKDERHADSNSHPHGRVADFDLGTQQNMEQFQKGSQQFVSAHNETLSVAEIRVSNPG